MLKIVEVPSNVVVLIGEVAALNWSDTIYPNSGYPSEKRRKSTSFKVKWPESTLDVSDVPETYVQNRWGRQQCFGVNQPSGRA